jgi:hypothetical protein
MRIHRLDHAMPDDIASHPHHQHNLWDYQYVPSVINYMSQQDHVAQKIKI